MQCPSCGNILEATDRFCPICGTAVNASAQNVPNATGAPHVQSAQYAPNAPHVQNAQYAPNAPYVQNAQYAQGASYGQSAQYAPNAPYVQNTQYAPNAQNVPMQPPGYIYGMQTGGGMPYAAAFPYQPPLSKKMFFSMYASAKVRRGIRSSAILCYVCAVLSVLYELSAMGTLYSLLDASIMVLMGVLIHTIQSRVAAVILLIYSVVNLIVAWVGTGSPGGWLIIVAGIAAVHATFSLNREYKDYHGQ